MMAPFYLLEGSNFLYVLCQMCDLKCRHTDHGVQYRICNLNISKPTGAKTLYFKCEIGVNFHTLPHISLI